MRPIKNKILWKVLCPFPSFHPDFPACISLSEMNVYVRVKYLWCMYSNTQTTVSRPAWFSFVLGTAQNTLPTGSASRLCVRGGNRCVRNKEGCFSAAAVLCLQIGFQEIWWMPNACSQLWRQGGGGGMLVWIWIGVSGTGRGLEFCPWPLFLEQLTACHY